MGGETKTPPRGPAGQALPGAAASVDPAAASDPGGEAPENCPGPRCEETAGGDLRRPWRRGGPGSATRGPAPGPKEAPPPLWEVELGAAISASPAFARGPQGDLVALVGTHAGRFVGVVVDGARAGALALDLNVPGVIWSSAAVDGAGHAYFGADDDSLHAVDTAAAALLWSLRLGACDPPRAPGPEGTRCDVDGGPTIGPGGDLFVGADGLYRVEVSGDAPAIRWHFPADAADAAADAADGADRGPTKTPTRLATTAAEPGARHVFAAPLVTLSGESFFGAQDGTFTALASDGGLRWSVALGADVDAAPVMLQNGWLVVGADDGRVIAIDPSGEMRWTYTAGADLRGALAVADDDTIYAASFDGFVHAIAGGDGALRWSYAAGAPIASSPVIDRDGHVYVGTRGDQVLAIDARGRRRWQIELPDDVDGLALSDGGVLVVSCDDGVLRAYR